MKKLQFLSFLATLAIAIGMISWGSALHAQTTPSTGQATTQQPSSTPDTTPPSQPPVPETPPASQQAPNANAPGSQQPSSPPASQSQSPDASTPESGSKAGSASGATATGTDSQIFSGTVVKQGSKYVLQDDAGKIYGIDHQSEVAKFEGKRVRVRGTLDPSGKKILVK